jgi:hypothetical protein
MNNKLENKLEDDEHFYRQSWLQTARTPEAWLCSAERLKHAADVLRENCWPRNRTDHNHDAAFSDHCYGPVYMLISGLAIESVIKGIIIATNPNLVEEQKMNGEILGHDLVQLFQKTGILKCNSDNDLLLRLQNYVENFGRYPVTRYKHDMAQKASTRFCSVDFGKVDRFWKRLLKHYEKIEKGKQMGNGLENLEIKNAAVKTIQGIVSKCSHFKIGKTGQNLPDRFNSEYENKYDRIVLVNKSSDSKEVDELESYLIDRFLSFDKYKSMCDNDAVGGGEMDNSDTYYVYVVVKD